MIRVGERMKRVMTGVGWAVYTCMAVVGFLYLSFPAEPVRNGMETFVSHQLQQEVSIGALDLHPPCALIAKDCRIRQKAGDPVLLEQVMVRPKLFAFASGKVGGAIASDLFGGKLEGDFCFSPSNPFSGNGSLGFTSLDLATLTGFLKDLPVTLTGDLSGRILWSPEEDAAKISGVFDMPATEVQLTLPLPVAPIRVQHAVVNGNLDKKRFAVKEVRVSGSFGTVLLSGEITNPLGGNRARLQLSGGIRPDPQFVNQLTKMGGIGAMVSRFVGQKEIPIEINGTAARPRLRVAGMRI